MLNFKSFIKLNESSTGHEYHVEMHLLPNHYPIYRFEKSQLNEVYTQDEHTLDDGEFHKTIGTFTPSSLDHDTITREFHEHLRKHGYYMYHSTHPAVLSPREQQFKSEFKRHRSGKTPKHEVPHHDDIASRTASRYNAVWSTRGPTKIFTKDSTPKNKTEIEGATHPNKVTIFNDKEVKHAASGEMNRWFLRASAIRKIPPNGDIVAKTSKGEEKNYGNDFESYLKDKTPNDPRHARDVKDHFEKLNKEIDKHRKAGNKEGEEEAISQQHRTASWLTQHYPEYHPDKLGQRWHGSPPESESISKKKKKGS